MKRHLPFQPQPQAGESVRSYVYRLAEGNNYESPNWLTHVPDIANFLRPIVEEKVTGVKPVWLELLLRGHKRIHRGIPGPRYKVVSDAKFCPLCLREGYWRAEWEYLYYTVCHIHEVELKSTCEECCSPSLWPRPKLMFCKCGADFSLQSTIPASHLETMLSKEVKALAQAQPSLGLLPVREVIGSDKFEDACSFIRIIGRHFNKRYLPGSKNAPVPDLSLARLHVQQTAAVLTNWPDDFRNFLHTYAKLDTADPNSYVRSRALTSLLKALLTIDRTAPVAIETRNLLSSHEPIVWDKRHYGPYPKPKSPPPDKFMHITAFSKRMRVSKRTIEDLIDNGDLYAIRRPRGKREFVLIPTAEAERAKSALQDKLSHKETAELLGISRKRLSVLREAWLFRAGKLRKHATSQYSYKQIHQFMSRFKLHKRRPRCNDARSLRDIAKYIASSDQEFVAIVQAIIDRDLRIVHHEPDLGALAGVHISQASLDNWRNERRRRILLVEDAAMRLGLKQEVAYHLVRNGLIKSSIERHGRRLCRIVLEEDLEQFTVTYISAVEMAKMYSTSPKHLVDKLFRREIHAKIGPTIDGGRQYFFLRTQLSYCDNIFGSARATA
jgi:hypothetical protein